MRHDAIYYANLGNRSSRLRRRAAGYNGRGRRNKPTNGHILQASSMAGSHRTLLTTHTPTSATNAPRTFIYDFFQNRFWTPDYITPLTFDQKDVRIPTFFINNGPNSLPLHKYDNLLRYSSCRVFFYLLKCNVVQTTFPIDQTISHET